MDKRGYFHIRGGHMITSLNTGQFDELTRILTDLTNVKPASGFTARLNNAIKPRLVELRGLVLPNDADASSVSAEDYAFPTPPEGTPTPPPDSIGAGGGGTPGNFGVIGQPSPGG